MSSPPYPFSCPRCDRPFTSNESRQDVENKVKKHVADAHPDYDLNWFETYPQTITKEVTRGS